MSMRWNNENGLPPSVPPVVPGTPNIRSVSGRIAEVIGSVDNFEQFVLAGPELNRVKGNLFALYDPVGLEEKANKPDGQFGEIVRQAVNGNQESRRKMLRYFNDVSHCHEIEAGVNPWRHILCVC